MRPRQLGKSPDATMLALVLLPGPAADAADTSTTDAYTE